MPVVTLKSIEGGLPKVRFQSCDHRQPLWFWGPLRKFAVPIKFSFHSLFQLRWHQRISPIVHSVTDCGGSASQCLRAPTRRLFSTGTSWTRRSGPLPLRLKRGFLLFSGDLRSMTRRSSSTVTSSTLRSSFFRIEFLFEKIILSDPDDIRSCGLWLWQWRRL